MKNYFVQLFIAVDQLLNAVLCGYADETLSARSWRAYRDDKLFGKITMPLIDLLFFWQSQENDKGHCYNAYLKEISRNNMPAEYRKFIKE